ncbi:MAG: YIP1 family protein [Planctomycetota bacterium]|nr:YIP1 family protein [Planctomycetota bacterium]
MRCKSCEYSLWNLTARQCPECGAPFKPNEFEFKPNAVCYCCLHCEQTYYGTTEQGHLRPEEFDCVKCGNHVHMDEMILRPTEGVPEQDTRADYNPWLERHREGRFRSWRKTIGRALIAPGRLMQSTPVESSTGQAWWYAIATSLIMTLVGMLLIVPIVLLFVLGTGPQGGVSAASILGSMSLGFGFTVVFSFFFIFIVVGIWGALTHVLLLMTGQVSHGIGRTYQAMCYSSGANIISALFFCGGQYVGWVWWIVSAIIMVKEGQKTSGLRASFAVLTLPVLLVAGVITMYAVFISMMISNAGNSSSLVIGSAMAGVDTTIVAESILVHADDHQGQGPGHGLQLVSDGDLSVMQLVPWSSSIESTTPLYNGSQVDFQDFVIANESARKYMADGAAAAMPEGLTAHRAGEFVFTHHGIDLLNADPMLWIVILAPIIPSPTNNTLPDTIIVGLADGTTLEFPIEEMMLFRLDDQNALRATLGLPALPDPNLVTNEQPAVESN